MAGGGAALALAAAVTLAMVNGSHSTSGSANPQGLSASSIPTVEATQSPTPVEVQTAAQGVGAQSVVLYATTADWRLSYDYTCAGGSGNLIVKPDDSAGPPLVQDQAGSGHGVVPGTSRSGPIRLSVQSSCHWDLAVATTSAPGS